LRQSDQKVRNVLLVSHDSIQSLGREAGGPGGLPNSAGDAIIRSEAPQRRNARRESIR
jgi:hypothetical protein